MNITYRGIVSRPFCVFPKKIRARSQSVRLVCPRSRRVESHGPRHRGGYAPPGSVISGSVFFLVLVQHSDLCFFTRPFNSTSTVVARGATIGRNSRSYPTTVFKSLTMLRFQVVTCCSTMLNAAHHHSQPEASMPRSGSTHLRTA